jgi:hypothetical protein
MTTPIHPDIPPQKIACSVFHEEVPLNLANTPVGADYIGHYGGIDCYDEFATLNQDAAPLESKLTNQK